MPAVPVVRYRTSAVVPPPHEPPQLGPAPVIIICARTGEQTAKTMQPREIKNVRFAHSVFPELS